MTSRDRTGGMPSRRAVLVRGATVFIGATAATTAAGCTASANPPAPGRTTPPSSADQLAAGRAVNTARSLLAAESGLSGDPRLRSLISTIADSHRAHLAALGAPALAVPPSPAVTPAMTPSATAGGAASASDPVSRTPVISPATAVNLELAAAAEAMADVGPTSPATAGLLARIAAARAVHADLLAAAARVRVPAEPELPPSGAEPTVPTSTVGGTTSAPAGSPAPPGGATASMAPDAATALSALLAGEHAAVFAYGVFTARTDAAHEALARTLWQAHRARRDDLERRLVAAGRPPVAAEPAYDVGRLPRTAAQLAQLAAFVENRLAMVALGAVTTSSGLVRQEAARDLVRAARRAAAWSSSVEPLPGTPA